MAFILQVKAYLRWPSSGSRSPNAYSPLAASIGPTVIGLSQGFGHCMGAMYRCDGKSQPTTAEDLRLLAPNSPLLFLYKFLLSRVNMKYPSLQILFVVNNHHDKIFKKLDHFHCEIRAESIATIKMVPTSGTIEPMNPRLIMPKISVNHSKHHTRSYIILGALQTLIPRTSVALVSRQDSDFYLLFESTSILHSRAVHSADKARWQRAIETALSMGSEMEIRGYTQFVVIGRAWIAPQLITRIIVGKGGASRNQCDANCDRDNSKPATFSVHVTGTGKFPQISV